MLRCTHAKISEIEVSTKEIKVVELFAGVGGFRLGLEAASPAYRTVWANQWEPGKKLQHAYNCYVSHFGTENHINENISYLPLDCVRNSMKYTLTLDNKCCIYNSHFIVLLVFITYIPENKSYFGDYPYH